MTNVTSIDSFEPDYADKCQNCETSPTVTGVKGGKTVYRSHLCGPCCFGEAACIDPAEWNGEVSE